MSELQTSEQKKSTLHQLCNYLNFENQNFVVYIFRDQIVGIPLSIFLGNIVVEVIWPL